MSMLGALPVRSSAAATNASAASGVMKLSTTTLRSPRSMIAALEMAVSWRGGDTAPQTPSPAFWMLNGYVMAGNLGAERPPVPEGGQSGAVFRRATSAPV